MVNPKVLASTVAGLSPHPLIPVSFEAAAGTDVLPLNQQLQKPETSQAAQLKTAKNDSNVFLCSSLVPIGSQTAWLIFIHCFTFSIAGHQLMDDQGCRPDYKKLPTITKGLRTVIK
jgi:hypothetical protein